MNYLLDTHVFLWMLSAPERLSPQACSAIQNPNHSVFVSAISAVEISIKSALGKLEAPDDLEEEIYKRGMQVLPLSYRHGSFLRQLPDHHQDPFDRMLIAQALVENFTLISHDSKMTLYDVKVLLT